MGVLADDNYHWFRNGGSPMITFLGEDNGKVISQQNIMYFDIFLCICCCLIIAPTTVCDTDGGWSGWSSWTRCDKVCGGGAQHRERLCDNPMPCGNGKNCPGHGREFKECNIHSCQGQLIRSRSNKTHQYAWVKVK